MRYCAPVVVFNFIGKAASTGAPGRWGRGGAPVGAALFVLRERSVGAAAPSVTRFLAGDTFPVNG